LLAISLIWLGGGRAHVVAQTATPGAENQTIAPEIATSQPESQTLSAETAQATAETESLSGDDGLDISAGIIAGVAAAAAILLAGIAYRIVRGRPRAE
jgi:hypothetical protein